MVAKSSKGWVSEILNKRNASIERAKGLGRALFPDVRRPEVFHLVSMDPERAGWWRASRFDDDGPLGHTTRRTIGEAVEVALDHGADLARGESVTPATVGAALARMAKRKPSRA